MGLSLGNGAPTKLSRLRKHKMYGFIYLTTNTINGKKYIGKRKLKNTEKDCTYLGSGKALRNAIKKYGRDNFSREILCECFSEEELNVKEKLLIEKYNAVNSDDFYNMIQGGKGNSVSGIKYISKGAKHKKVPPHELEEYLLDGWELKGPQQTAETKLKRADANRGKKRSKEVSEKISNALMGKTLSEKHKLKLSESHKGKITSNAIKIVCIETGELFNSIRNAASKYGAPGSASNICNCLKGKIDTAFGLHWKYEKPCNKLDKTP